jgi:hypothetical protein
MGTVAQLLVEDGSHCADARHQLHAVIEANQAAVAGVTVQVALIHDHHPRCRHGEVWAEVALDTTHHNARESLRCPSWRQVQEGSRNGSRQTHENYLHAQTTLGAGGFPAVSRLEAGAIKVTLAALVTGHVATQRLPAQHVLQTEVYRQPHTLCNPRQFTWTGRAHGTHLGATRETHGQNAAARVRARCVTHTGPEPEGNRIVSMNRHVGPSYPTLPRRVMLSYGQETLCLHTCAHIGHTYRSQSRPQGSTSRLPLPKQS